MTAVIFDLAERMALAPETRRVLGLLRAGDRVQELLKPVIVQLPKIDQRCLCTVLTFAFMGSTTPANIGLLERMPLLRDISPEETMAAFQRLVEQDVLVYEPTPKDDPNHGKVVGRFFWPALERLVIQSLEEFDAPRIFTPDVR